MNEPTKRFDNVDEWKEHVSKELIDNAHLIRKYIARLIRKYIELEQHKRAQQELHEEQKKACEEYCKCMDALEEELKGKTDDE